MDETTKLFHLVEQEAVKPMRSVRMGRSPSTSFGVLKGLVSNRAGSRN